MKAHTASSTRKWTLNDLHRGGIYRAITASGTAIGEYLGIETPHGIKAILLRNNDGTTSLAIDDVTSVTRLAA